MSTLSPPLGASADPPASNHAESDDETNAGQQQQHVEASESFNVGWTILQTTGSAPCERQWASVAVLGPNIFVFGGVAKRNNTSKYLGDFFQYDSELRKWTDLSDQPNRPAPRHSATIVSHGNRLFLFGGCGEGQVPLSDLWLYDITTNRWTRVKKENESSVNTQEAKQVYKKTSRMVGGPSYSGPNRSQNSIGMPGLFATTVLTGPVGRTMNSTMMASKLHAPAAIKEDWPRARYSHSAVVYNDNMYVYGGWMSDWSKGELVWRLDLTNLTWNEVELSKPSPVPDRRFGHISAVWDHTMYIFGGNRSTKTTQEMWAFHLTDRRWTQIETAGNPGPRKWHTGVVVENSWVIHGGVSGETSNNDADVRNDAFSFDFRTSTWSPLPQLIAKDESQPVDCHSGCIVSSEFSHSFYLLFGRRRNAATPPPSQAFVLDFFRPAAHLQIEDDEAALCASARFIEQRSAQFFRSNIDQLSEQLAPMRNSFEEDILPALEKHLKKVAAKIASSGGETESSGFGPEDGAPMWSQSVNCNSEDIALLKQIIEGLSDADRLYQAAENVNGEAAAKEASAVQTFMASLATVLECSEDDLSRLMLGGEPLPTEKSQKLKRMIPSLQLLDEYRSQTVFEFIMPGIEQSQDMHDVPLSRVSRSFMNQASEPAEVYFRTTETLKEGHLQPKQRRALEMQKTEAGKALLMKLEEKMGDMLKAFKTSPLGDNICEKKLCESYETKKKTIETEVAACKKGGAKQEKILSYLDKVEREKRRVRIEALSQFEEKRSTFVAQRSALVDEIRTFLETKLDAYAEILQEERQLILEAELYKREADEMSRRAAEMKQSAERPRLQKAAAQAALNEVVAPVLDTLMEEQKEILCDMERTVGSHCAVIAEDTARDVARFEHLMDEVHGQLEKQLSAQENSLKMIQSRIESKRDYMAVMMATSAGAETVAEEEGTREEVEAQIEQLELTLSNLHMDMEVTRKGLSEMNELNDNFNSQITTLKQVHEESVFPSGSNMRQVITSGFDWENALNSAFSTVNESFDTWIATLSQSSPQRLSPVKQPTTDPNEHARGITRPGRPTKASPGRSIAASFGAPAGRVQAVSRSIAAVNRLDMNRVTKRGIDQTPKSSTHLSRFADPKQQSRVRGPSVVATARTPHSRR